MQAKRETVQSGECRANAEGKPLFNGNTSVVEFCCGPGPVIANILKLSLPEGEICSLRFAVQYVRRHASLSETSPVRSSAVPRSETAEKRNTSVGVAASVGGQSEWIHMVLVAAADVMHHALSRMAKLATSIRAFYNDNFCEVTSCFEARASCFI